MILENSLLVLLIIVLPFIAAALIPALRKAGDKALAGIAVVAAFLLAALVLLLVPEIFFGATTAITQSYDWIPSAGIIFSVYIDPLALLMALIAVGIGALTVLYSVKYMEGKKGLARYYSLVILFIGSMVCLVFTDNLLVLYIFWEIIGLCSYALIGFYNTDPKAARAGIKAFVMTRVGDVGLLLGIFLLYAGTGTFSISDMVSGAVTVPATHLSLAAFLFILGAMGKSAQVPLHTWLPDAMEAPTTVSSLIHAATLVNAGIYILARMSPLFIGVEGWTTALLLIGGITALLAAIMALVEPDLKRVLAYSTISQLGYMVFALGIGVGGVFAASYHLMSHAVFKGLLFLCAGAIIHAVGTRNMYSMGGLKKEMKVTHFAMLFGTLALAGLVPFSGFWSKDLIFAGAYGAELWIPLAFMVFIAILTVAYSLRMYYLVFHGKSKRAEPAHKTPAAMAVPLVILAIGAIASWALIGIFSEAFYDFGFADAHAYTIFEFIEHTFTSLAVVFSFIALGLGIMFFLGRKDAYKNKPVRSVLKAAGAGFGFDRFYDGIVIGLKEFGLRLRKTQTGDANINSVGIVAALLLILIFIFFWGVF